MTTPLEKPEPGPQSPGGPVTATPERSPVATVVLIADDNVDSANTLRQILEHFGCKVHVAYDGPTAMATAESQRPHVAMLDIAMPGASGYDVARWIRQQGWGRTMRLVAHTAYGDAGAIEQAREAGFDLHLRKPVGVGELMQALGIGRDEDFARSQAARFADVDFEPPKANFTGKSVDLGE